MRTSGILILVAVIGLQGGPDKAVVPRVLFVTITGELNAGHLGMARRALRMAQSERPALVVFEIDTPGGRADWMLAIGEVLVGFAPTPTAAWVRPHGSGGGAWSAGVYLAISCDRLFMHPGTVIGAATPVQQTGEQTSEKYVSAFREKFRARAEQKGYPGTLIAAMVDPDIEMFEAAIDGTKRFLTRAEAETLGSKGMSITLPDHPISPKGKLVTLTDQQAAEAGISRTVTSRSELINDAGLGGAGESTLELSWSEVLAGILTTGLATTLLLAIGFLGIWLELSTPGFGVAGVVGILALALLLFGHHLAGLAETPEIVLFVIGVALVAAEIFLWPGTWISAIAGGICILAGLILSFQGFSWPDSDRAPWEVDIILSTVGRVVVALAIAAIGLAISFRILPRVPVLGRLVLTTDLQGTAPAGEGTAALVGLEGVVLSPLRPSGKAELAGRIVDVVTEGEYVPRGARVEVLRVEGLRVVVVRLA